jgi:lipopolysaccharide export system protein LptC
MRTRSGAALFPLVVLGALAGFTFWMERASQEGVQATRGKERHDPDFWINNLTLKRYDAGGSMQNMLAAKRLEHYPDDKSSLVFEPRMEAFTDRRSTATADKARVDREIKHVRLEGNVQVFRPGVAGQPDTVITTDVLEVRPDDEYAHTASPVTVTRGETVLHGAGGIEINNKTRVVVVKGPVQGIIDRKPK